MKMNQVADLFFKNKSTNVRECVRKDNHPSEVKKWSGDYSEKVSFRPLTLLDRSNLQDFFLQLSPKSRYQRFLGAKPALSKKELDWLLTIDPAKHWAWVATEKDRGALKFVGVIHAYRIKENGEAEIGLAVLDEWQGQGIGQTLLESVSAEVGESGIQKVHGYALQSNQSMLRLASKYQGSVSAQGAGTLLIEFWVKYLRR